VRVRSPSLQTIITSKPNPSDTVILLRLPWVTIPRRVLLRPPSRPTFSRGYRPLQTPRPLVTPRVSSPRTRKRCPRLTPRWLAVLTPGHRDPVRSADCQHNAHFLLGPVVFAPERDLHGHGDPSLPAATSVPPETVTFSTTACRSAPACWRCPFTTATTPLTTSTDHQQPLDHRQLTPCR